jgi:DNA-binding IclR family transcriptional regulator
MAETRAGRAEPALSARQPRAIHTALTVLEAVAELGAGVTAKELSARLTLPRATTYRLLNLLVQDEYLVRTPDLSGFALGAKVAQLAAAAVPRRLPTLARDIVADVRGEMRGGIHVAAYEDRRLQLLDEDPDFPFSDPVRLAREPERYALGALMLLAAGDDGSVAAAAGIELSHLGGVRRVDATVVGYGCLAVPLHRSDGGIAGAIAFAGPRHRVVDAGDVLARLAPVAERLAPYIA